MYEELANRVESQYSSLLSSSFHPAGFNAPHARVKLERFAAFSAGVTEAQRCTRTCSKLPDETHRTSELVLVHLTLQRAHAFSVN